MTLKVCILTPNFFISGCFRGHPWPLILKPSAIPDCKSGFQRGWVVVCLFYFFVLSPNIVNDLTASKKSKRPLGTFETVFLVCPCHALNCLHICSVLLTWWLLCRMAVVWLALVPSWLLPSEVVDPSPSVVTGNWASSMPWGLHLVDPRACSSQLESV